MGWGWKSWEPTGITLLLFSFNSSFAHHVFKCKQKQFVLSVFPSRPPLFLPWPLNHSPAGPSFAHFVSACLFMSTLLCVSHSVLVAHTHKHTHTQKPEDLDQFPVEKRGVALRHNIWKWAFCSRQPLHSDLIILSCWRMCVSDVCVRMQKHKSHTADTHTPSG